MSAFFETSAKAFTQVPEAMIGGLPLAVIGREASAKLMLEKALEARGKETRPLCITSANGQVVSLCARDPAARGLFMAADLIHADGMPLVFASRLAGALTLPERVATTDLFHDVAGLAVKTGARFYMLGAREPVVRDAVKEARRLYPGLDICGYRNGYFSSLTEEAEAVAAINDAAPDILWVGMGVPFEQAFMVRNAGRLRNVGVIKTSGGLFDFLSGRNSRAPHWMQAAGFEWLYRVVLEPRRLGLRYLATNPHAVFVLATKTG